ncbi:hypothetical protein HJC99_03390 [Candidatus Saccharibacteria bacterium]|nr:hypothetical protein [Candidatus Saccharibacteria bacterium]
MNSGFVTPHRVINRVGIHQRFDTAAFHMIARYLPTHGFPTLKDIVYFEGYNGPDGLKVKSPGVNEPSHLYDPINDKGEVPLHITNHYAGLVRSIQAGDRIRGAFEASWLAHYICDGLTPAHHWPLEAKVAEAASDALDDIAADTSRFTATLKKYWAVWGVKGHMSTHFYFESGIALALMSYPIRATYSDDELAKARQLGALEYFKAEARNIAALDLYERFYVQGWSPEILNALKNQIAPLTARTIGMIWLLAVLEAGEELALDASAAAEKS